MKSHVLSFASLVLLIAGNALAEEPTPAPSAPTTQTTQEAPVAASPTQEAPVAAPIAQEAPVVINIPRREALVVVASKPVAQPTAVVEPPSPSEELRCPSDWVAQGRPLRCHPLTHGVNSDFVRPVVQPSFTAQHNEPRFVGGASHKISGPHASFSPSRAHS